MLSPTRSQLLGTLQRALAENTYERRFQALVRVDLLIFDDHGLGPLRSLLDEDLHYLIAERYERGSTAMTSNHHFSEWGEAFLNRLLGAATLDRLGDSACRVVLEGHRYRKPRHLPDAFCARSAATPSERVGTKTLPKEANT